MIGVFVFTALISIRSWYQPQIKIHEPSPITVVLERDTEVTDKVATDEAKEKAKLGAINNLGNQEILSIIQKISQKNLAKLKSFVKVIREVNSGQNKYADPIITKISPQKVMTKLWHK